MVFVNNITDEHKNKGRNKYNKVILDQHYAEHAYQTHTFFPDAPSPLSPLSG